MAKKYRGKHPYNDAKVEVVVDGKIANAGKQAREYAKLKNNDLKNQYLRTNYYATYGEGKLAGHTQPGNNKTVILTATDGTAVTFTAKTSVSDVTTQFVQGTNVDWSGSLYNVITGSALAGKITPTVGSASISLKQVDPGPDGNTSIGGNHAAAATNFTGG